MKAASGDTSGRSPYSNLDEALRTKNFPALDTFIFLSECNKLDMKVFSTASLATLTTLILTADVSILFEDRATFFSGTPALQVLHLHFNVPMNMLLKKTSILSQAFAAGQLQSLREIKLELKGDVNTTRFVSPGADRPYGSFVANNVERLSIAFSGPCYLSYDQSLTSLPASLVMNRFQRTTTLNLSDVRLEEWSEVEDSALLHLRSIRLVLDRETWIPLSRMKNLEALCVKTPGFDIDGRARPRRDVVTGLFRHPSLKHLKLEDEKSLKFIADVGCSMKAVSSGIISLSFGRFLEITTPEDIETFAQILRALPRLQHVSFHDTAVPYPDIVAPILTTYGGNLSSVCFSEFLGEKRDRESILLCSPQLNKLASLLRGVWVVSGESIICPDKPKAGKRFERFNEKSAFFGGHC